MEFENKRRWEGQLFHEYDIESKADQPYYKVILNAIKEYERTFDEKTNYTTCKNIRRCLRIHLHRLENLKIPSYEDMYDELGLNIWVRAKRRRPRPRAQEKQVNLVDSNSSEISTSPIEVKKGGGVEGVAGGDEGGEPQKGEKE